MIRLGAHKTVEVKGSKLKDVHLNGQAKAHFSNFALPPHAWCILACKGEAYEPFYASANIYSNKTK